VKRHFCTAAYQLAQLTLALVPEEVCEATTGLGSAHARLKEWVETEPLAMYVCRAASVLDAAEFWLGHEHNDEV
jgi:hypothetical protein